MYSLKGYGSMVADRVRMAAYEQALRASVKPGSVVLDIGTGTGVFALLAARLGARRVYAIEPSEAILVARELAAANGCVETIEFMQGLSTALELPEKADVIVSDLRGVTPLHQGHVPSVADARNRWLAPGGVLIPERDALWTALVEAPDLHAPLAAPWGTNDFGFNLKPLRTYLSHRWFKADLKAEQMVSEPALCGVLDYRVLESPDFRAEVELTAIREGRVHGLALWFDATLLPGIAFSNAPGQPEVIYGQAFLPWPEPRGLAMGDRVTLRLAARMVAGEYLWSWDSDIHAGEATDAARTTFRQSTFFCEPIDPGALHRRGAGHIPNLRPEGMDDLWILQQMAEGVALGEIARVLVIQRPGRYPGVKEALERVGDLSQKYSR